jgi:hypothetical protein
MEDFTKELIEDTLEKQAFTAGTRLEPRIESGEGRAVVLDSVSSS